MTTWGMTAGRGRGRMPIERKRMILGGLVLVLGMSVGALSQAAAAQQQPAPAANSQASPAPSDVPPPPKKAVAAKKKAKPAKSAPTPSAAPANAPTAPPLSAPPPPAVQSSSMPPPAQKPVAEKKKGKQAYTGPATIVEIPATPMLDADGKQRLDPDGKPMFNPPVKQQRDKNGHPAFDDHGNPVLQTATDLGYDEKGKKIKAKKEKVVKTASLAIAEGTLTVDGMIGKATLNYDIKDFKYIYMYAPWIGTVVVSNRQFPGAKEQAKAFDQHTLTVTVEDHQFQLYSEKILLGKKPEPGYVAVDREFKLDSKFPAMGYGTTLQAPYNWPGAKGNPESKAYVKPPPVPKDLRQTRLLAACPDGMARTGAPAAGTAEPSCVAGRAPKAGGGPADGPAPAAPEAPAPATPPSTTDR